jgi:hypothetical protein
LSCGATPARTGFRLAPQTEFHLVHSYVAPTSFIGNVRAQARGMHVREMNRMIDEELSAFLARLGDRLPPHKRLVVEGLASEVLLQAHCDVLVAKAW